jgi:hypothetical protein
LQALLRRDERRREKTAGSRYPNYELAPVFDAPDQECKLRIVNALMQVLARLGYECGLWSQHEPSFRARISSVNRADLAVNTSLKRRVDSYEQAAAFGEQVGSAERPGMGHDKPRTLRQARLASLMPAMMKLSHAASSR